MLEMLKNENQLRGIVERVVEDKLFEALKGVAKIEAKTVSQEGSEEMDPLLMSALMLDCLLASLSRFEDQP